MAHLLIVEDDELLRDGLSAQLMQAGHRIDSAADGEQALERLGSDAYEGVVLDLGLPKLDGLTVLRRLRLRLLRRPSTRRLRRLRCSRRCAATGK